MRTWWLALLAACGGGDSGSFDANVMNEGMASQFAESCKLTESDEYWDIYSKGDDVSFELKWKKAIITTAGTYTSSGIVSDISLFVLLGTEIKSGSGSVTFTTYAPPNVVGTFDLTIPNSTFSATGAFDCR
jgi:hypothetical protein